jgi:hypothetical protein
LVEGRHGCGVVGCVFNRSWRRCRRWCVYWAGVVFVFRFNAADAWGLLPPCNPPPENPLR